MCVSRNESWTIWWNPCMSHSTPPTFLSPSDPSPPPTHQSQSLIMAYILERIKHPVLRQVDHGVATDPVNVQLLQTSQEIHQEYLYRKRESVLWTGPPPKYVYHIYTNTHISGYMLAQEHTQSLWRSHKGGGEGHIKVGWGVKVTGGWGGRGLMGKEGINPLVGKHCFMSGKETVRVGEEAEWMRKAEN